MNDFDYVDVSTLPEHMQGAVRRYLNDGIMPGDFLATVLENDLAHSYQRADTINLEAIPMWARWLIWECPAPAWGSPAKVREWAMRRTRAREQAPAPATTEEAR